MGLNTGNNVVEIDAGIDEYLGRIEDYTSTSTKALLAYHEEAIEIDELREYDLEYTQEIAEKLAQTERLQEKYPFLSKHMKKYGIPFASELELFHINLDSARIVTELDDGPSGSISYVVTKSGDIIPVPYNKRYIDIDDSRENTYDGVALRDFLASNDYLDVDFLIIQDAYVDRNEAFTYVAELNINKIDLANKIHEEDVENGLYISNSKVA